VIVCVGRSCEFAQPAEENRVVGTLFGQQVHQVDPKVAIVIGRVARAQLGAHQPMDLPVELVAKIVERLEQLLLRHERQQRLRQTGQVPIANLGLTVERVAA
jgi:hypothetical protein